MLRSTSLDSLYSQYPQPPDEPMGFRQPTGAGWTSLPEPLAGNILRQAIQDGGRSLRQWLDMSLVCRCALIGAAALVATLNGTQATDACCRMRLRDRCCLV